MKLRYYLLFAVAFCAGMRTQVAIAPSCVKAPPPTISLDCRKDGSVDLNMGGTVVDGDHVIQAIERAAKTVCSRNGA